MRKLCLSTKFSHQEIRWKYGILRSGSCSRQLGIMKKSFCDNLLFHYNQCCSGNIAASIVSLFHGDCCSEIRWKKVPWPNWIAGNFNIRKMHSNVERMGVCEYSKNNYSTYCWKNYSMDDCKFSGQNKYSTIQGMDECHSYCDKNRCTTSTVGWLQLKWWKKKTTLKKIECLR